MEREPLLQGGTAQGYTFRCGMVFVLRLFEGLRTVFPGFLYLLFQFGQFPAQPGHFAAAQLVRLRALPLHPAECFRTFRAELLLRLLVQHVQFQKTLGFTQARFVGGRFNATVDCIEVLFIVVLHNNLF